ncbi:MAG TPA: ABC transporter ATP-binding protein [Burkholderiales bacterium]|nr:ABC transporter ATP-binding protein [Burkholderiales bacterium]
MSLLEVRALRGGYGAVDILNGIDLDLGEGDLVAVIGPNGAGKSTLMKAIFGLVALRAGTVRFQGEDITGERPDRIVRRGLAYVPQERNVFASLSVQENLEMGAFIRRDDFSAQIDRVYSLFPRLGERRRQAAGTLSGGERQMLAMGRALMLEPRLLMLDEPTAGLAPNVVDYTFARILDINRLGIGVLMVEQNAKQALAVAQRGVVLVMGVKRYEAPGRELLHSREVAEMFLGA